MSKSKLKKEVGGTHLVTWLAAIACSGGDKQRKPPQGGGALLPCVFLLPWHPVTCGGG